MNEFQQSDSASVYEIAHIKSNDWLGNTVNNISSGEYRGDNTSDCFTHLNIEFRGYGGGMLFLWNVTYIGEKSTLRLNELRDYHQFRS